MKYFLLLALVSSFSLYSKEKIFKCGTDGFIPYTIYNEKTKKLTGPEADMLFEMAKRAGIKTKLNYYPWKRLLASTKDGDLDCMFAAFKTPEREEFANFMSVPFHVSTLSVFVHKKSKFEFSKLEDLFKVKVGIVRGFSTNKEFDAAVKEGKIKVEELTSHEQLFKMIDKNRLESTVINHDVGMSIIKKFKLKDVRALPTPLSSNSAYLIVSKKSEYSHLINTFNSILFEMMVDGTVHKLYKKHKLR